MGRPHLTPSAKAVFARALFVWEREATESRKHKQRQQREKAVSLARQCSNSRELSNHFPCCWFGRWCMSCWPLLRPLPCIMQCAASCGRMMNTVAPRSDGAGVSSAQHQLLANLASCAACIVVLRSGPCQSGHCKHTSRKR